MENITLHHCQLKADPIYGQIGCAMEMSNQAEAKRKCSFFYTRQYNSHQSMSNTSYEL